MAIVHATDQASETVQAEPAAVLVGVIARLLDLIIAVALLPNRTLSNQIRPDGGEVYGHHMGTSLGPVPGMRAGVMRSLCSVSSACSWWRSGTTVGGRDS